MNQTPLCDAIRARKFVTFRYKTSTLVRTFSPYIVYRKADQSLSVAGYSEYNPEKPLERHEWRNLDVDQISSLSITKETFSPDASFDPLHERYAAGTICHVKQYL